MLGPARRLTGGVTDAEGRFDGAAAFRQGFVSNVLNPKLVVFFISVLPAFTADGGSFFGQVVILGVAFEALTAAVAALLRRRRRQARRAMRTRACGTSWSGSAAPSWSRSG